ncbi:MAG: lipase family protein [Bacteroidales bacterium]|nr:lipase family protein [Bacteroidales bacterium]
MKAILITIIISFWGLSTLSTQSILKPGFDPTEYRDMLRISMRQADSTKHAYPSLLAAYPTAKMVYQSPEVGIYNQWEMWITPNNIGVISIRGTIAKMESWMENFYSGMIPAEGRIKIDSSQYFDYKLADDSMAYVHTGWTIALAAIGPDIVSKINDYHSQGITDFIIVGHSQGGAIAFLLRSYLHYLKQPLARNITIKTYCSAAPKPGNLYYAYDFDLITRGGWALRVVNTEDWVPEMPFSIQTLDDVNEVSPFNNGDALFKNVSFAKRMYLEHAYKKMDKSTKKAQKVYTQYLGNKTYEFVTKTLAFHEKPNFVKSFNYSTCGTPIILRPGNAYRNNYLKNKKQHIFINHLIYPYYLITLEMYPERG